MKFSDEISAILQMRSRYRFDLERINLLKSIIHLLKVIMNIFLVFFDDLLENLVKFVDRKISLIWVESLFEASGFPDELVRTHLGQKLI